MARQRLKLLGISMLFFLALLLSSCAPNPVLPDDVNEQPDLNLSTELPDEPELPGASAGAADSEPILKSLRIGLYNGVGAWDINVTALQNFFNKHELTYELINENDVASLYLRDYYDLIWFPGGFAGEYRYAINDHDPLIEFVNRGGYYVGSCAGAYFAADILSWQGDEKKDYDYPLNFFLGTAAGPMVGELNWGDEALLLLSRENSVNAGFGPVLPVYYFDGPYFAAFPETDYLILARYEKNNLPAVIAGHYGEGKYLLFGPHPELGGINIQSGDYDLEGGTNAQWDWLLAILYWFGNW